MQEPDLNTEQSKERWSLGSALASVDVLLYGGLGAALLCFIVYELGKVVWSSGSPVLRGGFVAFVVGTVLISGRDLHRKRFSPASRLLVGAWVFCVAAVILQELLG